MRKSSDVQVRARLDHPVRPIRHHSIHGLPMANETPLPIALLPWSRPYRVLRSLDTHYVVEVLPMEGVADPRRSHDEAGSVSSAIRAVKT